MNELNDCVGNTRALANLSEHFYKIIDVRCVHFLSNIAFLL